MTSQSVFEKLILRIYSFLLHVLELSPVGINDIQTMEKRLYSECAFFIFLSSKNSCCNRFFKSLITYIMGSPQMFLVSRCIFL